MIYNVGPRTIALAMCELLKQENQTEQVKRRLLSIVLEGVVERTTEQDGDMIRQEFEEMYGEPLKW